MAYLSKIVSLLSLATIGLAGTPIPNIFSLTLIGNLDGCSVDAGGEYNAGGSISVDGWTIKVPKNLIVQFPVVWAPFSELCGAGAGGYEVSVVANVVNGEAIAGQIVMSPGLSLRTGGGYIESLTTDTMKLRGGPTLRINDPNGVFGKASNGAPFFPVDDENPSITAFSGFPMCLPRSSDDPKCPQSNRPDGATNFKAPDSRAMVPIRVGDFFTYSGIKSGGEILVYEMSATNVQVTTTASDTDPNYIFVEDALVGVVDTANNIEIADYRFIGYLSSCSGASVSVYAIDVDPCTGEENLRQIGSATPKNGDVRCKWEARIPSTSAQLPHTREYMIKANNPVIETKDGIKAGQYVIPVTEWIFPEVNVPGTEVPPFRFDNVRGLVQGDFLDNKRYGPLSPFPGPDPPAPSKTCSGPVPTSTGGTGPTSAPGPVAFARAIDATQRVGAAVPLVAGNSNSDIVNSDLVFSWTKTSPSSPSVSLVNPAAATATFNAPTVSTETSFVFEVTVSLKSDTTKTSKANVTVKVNPTAADIVTVDTYSWASSQSGTIGVTCSSNVVNGDNKKMSLLLNSGATTLTMTKTGNGKWSYSSRSVKKPTNIQCVSDLSGKSELVTNPRRRKRGFLGNLAGMF